MNRELILGRAFGIILGHFLIKITSQKYIILIDFFGVFLHIQDVKYSEILNKTLFFLKKKQFLTEFCTTPFCPFYRFFGNS